jgi:hypothetical protein
MIENYRLSIENHGKLPSSILMLGEEARDGYIKYGRALYRREQ